MVRMLLIFCSIAISILLVWQLLLLLLYSTLLLCTILYYYYVLFYYNYLHTTGTFYTIISKHQDFFLKPVLS